MPAGMAVAAHDQRARQAQTQFGTDDVHDALARLVDIEHRDAACRGFGAQTRQQFQSDLGGAGTAARGRNRVVRRGKGQFGIMDGKIAVLEIEQAARTAEVVQQMAVDMEKVRIIADAPDDVLVPDLGQHGATRRGMTSRFQVRLPFWPRSFTVVRRYRLGTEGLFGPRPWSASKHRRPRFG